MSNYDKMKRLDRTMSNYDKMKRLDDALKGLEGVSVPWNLIVNCFAPIQRWLNKELRGDEKDFG